MAVQPGTIVAVEHQRNWSIGVLQQAIIHVNFPIYTGSADTFSIAGVGARIEADAKRGKTNTLINAIVISPGIDAAGVVVYPCDTTLAAALTVATDALNGSLRAVDLTTEVTSSAATTTPARILVTYTEA